LPSPPIQAGREKKKKKRGKENLSGPLDLQDCIIYFAGLSSEKGGGCGRSFIALKKKGRYLNYLFSLKKSAGRGERKSPSY